MSWYIATKTPKIRTWNKLVSQPTQLEMMNQVTTVTIHWKCRDKRWYLKGAKKNPSFCRKTRLPAPYLGRGSNYTGTVGMSGLFETSQPSTASKRCNPGEKIRCKWQVSRRDMKKNIAYTIYTPLCRAWLSLQPNSLIKHHKPTAISTFATLERLAYGRRDSDEDTAPKRFDPTQWSHTNLGRKPRFKSPRANYLLYVFLGWDMIGLLLKNDGLDVYFPYEGWSLFTGYVELQVGWRCEFPHFPQFAMACFQLK